MLKVVNLRFSELCDFQVASGRLLKTWNAHYRAVTCLVFSDDDSLLVSGSEDGSIKVWSLLMYVVFLVQTSIFVCKLRDCYGC